MTLQFPVLSFMADTEDHLSLTGLCRVLQDAAWQHAIQLGFGPEDLAERGLLWVLSRLLVRVERYPRWSQTVSVETWPSGVERLFAMRDFRLTCEGEPVATVRSAWLGIDAATRRPMPPARFIDVNAYRGAETVFPDLPEKLPALGPESGLSPVGTHRVVYSDFDRQRHVNNVQYLQWMLDTFDLDFQQRSVASELTINFLAEAAFGETVDLYRRDSATASEVTVVSPAPGSPAAPNRSTAAAATDASGLPVAAARIMWRPR